MMTRRKRQVAKAFFDGRLNEAEIIAQYNLSPPAVRRWLETDEFERELQRHCRSALRKTRFIIARNGPVAALKLAELLESDKPDVARRAALDLIDRCLNRTPSKHQDENEDPGSELSDEQARRMILALAEGLGNAK